MAAANERRRRRESKAKKAWKLRDAPTSIDDLPDDLLECVLVRLVGSPLCLIRAAFACKSFCRLVADAPFRSLVDGRSPVVLGHYYALDMPERRSQMGNPPFVPASSSSLGGSGGRNCFSLDYLPFDRPRELIDSRGSLLLFDHGPWGTSWHDRHYPPFPDLLVCEPLTRWFQGIACIPPSLVGSVRFLSAYLIDGGESCGAGGVNMSNYRVVCKAAGLAFVFSPGSEGGWSFIHNDGDLSFPRDSEFVGRAAGKIYWHESSGRVQVLDEATVTFSVMEFPEHMWWAYDETNLRVIGGGGVRVVRMTGQDLDIYGEIGGGQWAVEKRVRLVDATRGLPGRKEAFFTTQQVPAAKIVKAGEGFVTLAPQENEAWLFSVDLETMEAEREHEHERNKHIGEAHPLAPPPLTSVLRARGLPDEMRNFFWQEIAVLMDKMVDSYS